MVKCVVQPEMDPRWYRGIIIHVNEPNYTVHLRDHGAKVDVLKTALLPISEDLKKVECMSIEMSLFGLKSKHVDFSAEKIREIFTKMIRVFDELAVSMQMKSGELVGILWGVHKTIFPLKPTRYTYTNLNILLVRMGFATATASLAHVDNSFPSVLPISYHAANGDRTRMSERYPWIARFKNERFKFNPNTKVTIMDGWLIEAIERRSKCAVFPTHVDSKLNIYVQDEYRRHIAERIKRLLTEKIRNRRESEFRCKPLDGWRRGEPCFAPFEDDYLRATFSKVNRSNKCVVG